MLRHSTTLLLAALSMAAAAPAQTTWFVSASAPTAGNGSQALPYRTIQGAIDAATTSSGDTLLIEAGTYAERIDLSGKDLVLQGDLGGVRPVIDAGSGGAAVRIVSGETLACTLRWLEVRGGTGEVDPGGRTFGGGALVDGASATFDRVVFAANAADEGAGLCVRQGSAVLDGCELSGGQASIGGGLSVSDGFVDVSFTSFEGNLAVGGPSEGGRGGGLHVGAGGAADLVGCTFIANGVRNLGLGGGLHVAPGAAACDVVDTVFTDNAPGEFASAGSGGAVGAEGPFTAEDCVFVGNGDVFGGAFRGGAGRGGTYRGCTFEDNTAQLGGALSGAEAFGCTFERNAGCADGSGRGGAAEDCDLFGCVLTDNWTCGDGGGAHGSNLVGCRVVYNRALARPGVGGVGGGLHSCDASRCILRGNEAQGAGPFSSVPAGGGGAFDSNLDFCVVTGNAAEIGGGVASTTFLPPPTYDHVTLVGNAADFGPGGAERGSFTSSILWNNIGGSAGSSASFAWSLVDTGGGLPPVGTGNLAVDPELLGPAGANVLLGPGSPAIDAGDPAFPADPDGSRTDMGALFFRPAVYEEPSPYCRPTRTFAGCLPLIDGAGTASLSGSVALEVSARGVPPGQFGLLFMGFALDSAPLAAGASSGATLCVTGPFYRFPVQTSVAVSGSGPCAGQYAQAVPGTLLASLGLAPGDFAYAQYWFRQPTTSPTVALTEGLEIPVLP